MLCVVALLLFACSTPKNNTDPDPEDNSQNLKLEIVNSSDLEMKTDQFTVESMSVEKDLLELVVCYSGCAEHDWKLITDRRYKKTNPPQLEVHLIHDQHNDPCKRRACDTLYFDISSAKYPGKTENYTVTINLFNSNKHVDYEY
jgi:hypothetical protein